MDTTAPQTPQIDPGATNESQEETTAQPAAPPEQEAPSVDQDGTGPQVEDTNILPEPEAPAVAESPPAEPDAKAE